MVLAIKLLDNNELSKIIFSKIFQNKHCTLCVENYLLKIMEDFAVGIFKACILDL